MPALLAPVPRQQEFSLGVTSPGALLNTWEAGQIGVRRRITYKDPSLLVPNSNPMEADAGGLLGPVYLTPCENYDFTLTNPAGVLIWSQPNVMAGPTSTQASSNPTPDFIQMEALLG